MGNRLPASQKTIHIDNINEEINKCEEIGEKYCTVYGHLHKIRYEGSQLFVGKCKEGQNINLLSLHYKVEPNVLVLSSFVMLQNYKLNQYEQKKQLKDLIKCICELSMQLEKGIGLSDNRVAYNKNLSKWCIYGDVHRNLINFQTLLQKQTAKGIYLSPQLMKSLFKDKNASKVDVKKSDVFIFAIILLQIIFQQNLNVEVFNYNKFQIKLAPILQKLCLIQQKFGNQIYEMFLRMLQFNPEQRITFDELKQQAQRLFSPEFYISPVNLKSNQITPPANTKPKLDSYSPSPQFLKSRTDDQLAQNRGRSPGVIRKNIVQTDRNKNSISPIRKKHEDSVSYEQINFLIGQDQRRRVSNGSKITPNRLKIWEGMQNQRPKVQPFGLRFDQITRQGHVQTEGRKTFSKLKTIRF